jgi:tryptophanyl-tRNA synthetase
VVDLHALTVPQDPAALRAKTLEIAKIYLASGIDPEKSTLFIQSQVPAHAELAWILGTVARVGDLEKMTQFKDKAKEGRETAGLGLYSYPVLMAADILLYDTDSVPVGKDQMQHIELARTLARRFNERFGETFKVPEGRLSTEGALIMALDDPTKKMSKSAASLYNYIALTDDADTIRKKIRKAVTDSGSEVVYEDAKPALRNLLNIFSLLSGDEPEAVASRYRNAGYGAFKEALADQIVASLAPFQERLATLHDQEVLAILEEGRKRATDLARSKMQAVRERLGLLV